MPTYEYHCDACGYGFEKFQPITAPAIRDCPKCKKRKVRRVITGGAGLIFKGSGFYQTDYRSKSYQDAAKKDSKPDAKKDSSSKSDTSTGSCGPAACKQPDVCYPEKK